MSENGFQSLVLVRRHEQGQERQIVTVKDSRLYTERPDTTPVLVGWLGADKLGEFLTTQFQNGWHPDVQGRLCVTTRYTIGEALGEFSPEEVVEGLIRTKASLPLKGRMIAYAVRAARTQKQEGAVNQNWSPVSREQVDTSAVGRFLQSLRDLFHEEEAPAEA